MEEKILIKSEVDKKLKEILRWLSVGLLGLCALFALILLCEFEVEVYHSGYYLGNTKYWVKGYTSIENKMGYEILFGGYDVDYDSYEMCMAFFIIACSTFVIGLPILIMFLATSKCELEITDKSAKGKTFFGKEVVLPMYMISAYSTRKFLSTIVVATSSGVTKFALVKNYAEIGNVLSQKINERQENTVHQTTVNTPTSQASAMDDLKKLKDLLDAGIITQEEFDAKKKQLLGL
jgi:hypothetical protein